MFITYTYVHFFLGILIYPLWFMAVSGSTISVSGSFQICYFCAALSWQYHHAGCLEREEQLGLKGAFSGLIATWSIDIKTKDLHSLQPFLVSSLSIVLKVIGRSFNIGSANDQKKEKKKNNNSRNKRNGVSKIQYDKQENNSKNIVHNDNHHHTRNHGDDGEEEDDDDGKDNVTQVLFSGFIAAGKCKSSHLTSSHTHNFAIGPQALPNPGSVRSIYRQLWTFKIF